MLGYGVRMESLAMAAAIIMLGIILFGVVSVVVATRPPKRTWSKVVAAVAVSPALAAGLWLALLDVGIGGRAIGAVVLGVGILAQLRIWRRD